MLWNDPKFLCETISSKKHNDNDDTEEEDPFPIFSKVMIFSASLHKWLNYDKYFNNKISIKFPNLVFLSLNIESINVFKKLQNILNGLNNTLRILQLSFIIYFNENYKLS